MDNAISANAKNVEIHLDQHDDRIMLCVADDGSGISIHDITDKILRMGGMGTNPGPMNEHGFGLKNSLSRLTEGARPFYLLTRDQVAVTLGNTYVIKGPLRPDMVVDLARQPEIDFWQKNVSNLATDTGTRVLAEASMTFLNSVLPARRGRPFRQMTQEHIDALGEHLGVFYRPFLDATHRIFVKWKDQDWSQSEVKALPVPYVGTPRNERIVIQHQGVSYEVYYKWGKLDKNLSLRTRRHKIYYQSNLVTQGVDVKVRKRIILPHQLTELFGLQRHNSMNDFVGELDLDNPAFGTVNNKTGLDVNNPLIESLLEEMSTRYLPPHDPRALYFSESELRHKIATTLENATPGGTVQELATVWSRVGVQIDIIQTIGRKHVIYEVKNEELEPLDAYQLRMYWDALVADGINPFMAKLVSPEEMPAAVRNIMRYVNQRKDGAGHKYRFEFVRSDRLLAGTPATRRRKTAQ